MEKKTTLQIIAVAVISLLIGFGIGWQIKLVQVQEEIDWMAAQLEKLYIPGVVTEIGDSFLVMEVEIPVNIFESEKQYIRVNVAEETEIFRFIETAALAEELLLSPEELEELAENLTGSSQKIFLSLKDIKTGDQIIVTSEENRGKKEIAASKIEISYQ